MNDNCFKASFNRWWNEHDFPDDLPPDVLDVCQRIAVLSFIEGAAAGIDKAAQVYAIGQERVKETLQ